MMTGGEMPKNTLNHTAYSKFAFRGASGYIVAPWISGLTYELMSIRHSACVPPGLTATFTSTAILRSTTWC